MQVLDLPGLLDVKKASYVLREKVNAILDKTLPSRRSDCSEALEQIIAKEEDEAKMLARIDAFSKVFFSRPTDLYYACSPEYKGLESVEEILKSGVSPNTVVWDAGEPDNLYSVLSFELAGWKDDPSHLPELTELLLNYGLDIDHPVIPYDNDWICHPMYHFSLQGYAYLPTLAIFLKHGISAESVEECIGMTVGDLIYVNTDVFDSDEGRDFFNDTVLKLLLVASYPEMVEKLSWLPKFIDVEHNWYDLENFRDYDNYTLSLDFSRCDDFPKPEGCEVTVLEKKTQMPVWKFVFAKDRN